jgi:23S rRNA (adenine2503-C2)-methyltransferase
MERVILKKSKETLAVGLPRLGPSSARPLICLTVKDLCGFLQSIGEKSFRATQIFEWLCLHGVKKIEDMKNLPTELRRQLGLRFPRIYALDLAAERIGKETRKFLWRAEDGALIESVLIRAPGRLTACLSIQVGCAMKCVFCATGQSGLQRNLTGGEIFEQFLRMREEDGRRADHVVFMGMGEPLNNYEETMAAIKLLHQPPAGEGLSPRRMTVSTVGFPDQIRRLAGEKIHPELAVSLHAPDDALRQRLMPTAKRWPIREILAAARAYFDHTGRLTTMEYVLLAEVNDAPETARRLAALLCGGPWKVNLVPYNQTEGGRFSCSDRSVQERFQKILTAAGLTATIRASKGGDVEGACGQLRKRNMEEQ